MSVIASNSVNFVPIYQLLKNVSDVKPKGMPNEQLAEKSNQILDVAELSAFYKVGQGSHSNPISSDIAMRNAGDSALQEKVLKQEKAPFDSQSVGKNADAVRSFIVDSKKNAMAQQATQSAQAVLALI